MPAKTIVVSGDADLTPAIDIVSKEGKKVFNVYFDKPNRNSRAVLPHCKGNFREITHTMLSDSNGSQNRAKNKNARVLRSGDSGSR